MDWAHAALRSTRIVFPGLLPMIVGGCGLALVREPPIGHERMEHFSCTQSNLGPILDVTAAVGGLVVVAVSQGEYYYYAQKAMIAIGLSTTALYGLSATFGFVKTKRCRAATQQLAERLAQTGQAASDGLAGDAVVSVGGTRPP